MSMMRHGDELSSDESKVEGRTCSQIVGAIARQPGIELCGTFTFAVSVLGGDLAGAKRLTKVRTKGSISNNSLSRILRYSSVIWLYLLVREPSSVLRVMVPSKCLHSSDTRI